MNVAELIEKLKQYPLKSNVRLVVQQENGGVMLGDAESVAFTQKDNTVYISERLVQKDDYEN